MGVLQTKTKIAMFRRHKNVMSLPCENWKTQIKLYICRWYKNMIKNDLQTKFCFFFPHVAMDQISQVLETIYLSLGTWQLWEYVMITWKIQDFQGYISLKQYDILSCHGEFRCDCKTYLSEKHGRLYKFVMNTEKDTSMADQMIYSPKLIV